MKNTNIGIANLVVSNKLKNSYFNHELIEESKKLTTDFFNAVRNSPILELEFKVFNNLENKTIENDLAATLAEEAQEMDKYKWDLGVSLGHDPLNDRTLNDIYMEWISKCAKAFQINWAINHA